MAIKKKKNAIGKSEDHTSNRILVVDDDEGICLLMKDLLTAVGYRVTVSSDSYEALDLVRSDPDQYNLIISDISMPKMTGLSLVKKIKHVRRDIPVILMSGQIELSSDSLEKLGVREAIQKPFNLEKIIGVVKEALTEAGSKAEAGDVKSS